LKQPDQWSTYAARIVATGERPHFAPEPETLAAHVRVLEALRCALGRSPLALVLGATPELADLALERGCTVVRMDCNAAMFEAAARRQRDVDRSNERIVVGDWLDMPHIEAGSIDLVLGDASLNNVPHAQMDRLVAQLRRVTRPGSVLSLRQVALPAKVARLHPLQRTVRRLRDAEIDRHTFSRLLRYACFVDEVYDARQCLLDAGLVFECIGRSHRDGLLNDAEYAFMNGRRSRIQHTVYVEGAQRRWFEPLGRCRIERAGPACDHEFLTNLWITERA
jgi:SAM-dependent methyltransferase